MKSVAVIGSGFSGLAAACHLAKAGFSVTVFEKHATAGGRARKFDADGFTFDMGPSWYWMPDVFESFFKDFEYTTSSFYQLTRLDPGFSVVFDKDVALDIPSKKEDIVAKFELIEKGSADKLRSFLLQAKRKYDVGMGQMVQKPTIRLADLFDVNLLKGLFSLQIFTSLSSHVRKYFKHPALLALMEFPVLFLGATPQDTPAMYSLMNYAALELGTWYPQGGFGKVVKGFASVAANQGVVFKTGTAVTAIKLKGRIISGLYTRDGFTEYKAVVAAADYHHVEQQLLPAQYRTYTPGYWDKRVMAPSCLIFYLGINKKINRLQHHTLFFDESLQQHGYEIYKQPQWPSRPLFYVCCPSKTDDTVAPANHENLFILMPLAVGLQDTDALRSKYFDTIMARLEAYSGQAIRPHIDYQKSYCLNDFAFDYNAFKGNAYGLANTLMQTANLKPALKSTKIDNLVYAGQLTVPGPGVPPSIISGKIAANELIKYLKKGK